MADAAGANLGSLPLHAVTFVALPIRTSMGTSDEDPDHVVNFYLFHVIHTPFITSVSSKNQPQLYGKPGTKGLAHDNLRHWTTTPVDRSIPGST